MAMKKSVSQKVSKTKAKVSNVIRQAKDSLKLLEAIDKTSIAKVANLRKIGVASADEVENLRMRVERLEGELAALQAKLAATGTSGVIPRG